MTKEELQYISDEIRSSVPCDEAGKAMGLHLDSKGRCACFFHGGSHKNLKLYDKDKGYYCFVCHEHGDVIRLVMNYMRCPFMDAVEWLNDTFLLHLDLEKNNPYSRRRRAETYARKQERKREHAVNSNTVG